MKALIFSLGLSVIFLSACNSDTSSNKTAEQDSSAVSEAGSDTDPGTSMKVLLTNYLAVKNALTKDDGKAAASAADDLAASFKAFDSASLKKEQVGIFEDIRTDAVEHAEHIAANAALLEHQREHFETLSEDLYELVKTFGAGQKLYYSNCPMYNDNKGANWLSETNEIQNPYLGQAMPTCGSVKEELN